MCVRKKGTANDDDDDDGGTAAAADVSHYTQH